MRPGRSDTDDNKARASNQDTVYHVYHVYYVYHVYHIINRDGYNQAWKQREHWKKSGLSKLAKWVVNPGMKQICVESDPKIFFSPSTKARPIAHLTQEIICVVLDGLCFDKPLSARKKTWGVAEPLVKCSNPWICNSLCLDYPLLLLLSILLLLLFILNTLLPLTALVQF